MAEREGSADIDDVAALWAARIDARPLTSAEDEDLERWLEADPRRQGAFARARAISLHMARAQALGPDFVNTAEDRRWRPSRRLVLAGGAGGAVAAGLAAAVTLHPFFRTQHFQTRLGEVRVVSLGDGSVVTLNTASEIAVLFSDAERMVELIRGEALFDSVSNRLRPFIVRAGATIVRTAGASFSVAHLAEAPIDVLVRAGAVDVIRGGSNEVPPTRLGAMQRATLTPQTAVVDREAAGTIARTLAWRDGRIAFEGQTLEDAASEFARYSRIRIRFAEPSIARETITGLFVSTDPVGFARAVGTAFDLHVHIEENEITLSRPHANFS